MYRTHFLVKWSEEIKVPIGYEMEYDPMNVAHIVRNIIVLCYIPEIRVYCKLAGMTFINIFLVQYIYNNLGQPHY